MNGNGWRSMTVAALVLLVGLAGAAGPPSGALKKCAVDAVVSGAGCMDKYEASVWQVPDPTGANKSLVSKIQQGKATADQLAAGGATQLGTTSDNYAPCADSGQNCTNDIYAVSLSGVTPSAYVTWFQAQAACKNARKRLPSNADWQAAVAGTPDGAPCNVSSGVVAATGTAAGCVSSDGAFDMVGNLWEWVADWVPQSTACPGWGSFSDDYMCLSGASTTANGPGALLRGGHFDFVTDAGPLAVDGSSGPSYSAAASGSAAPASHVLVGDSAVCALASRGWAGVFSPVRPRDAAETSVLSGVV